MQDKYNSALAKKVRNFLDSLRKEELESEHFFELIAHFAFVDGYSIKIDWDAMNDWLNEPTNDESPRTFNPYLFQFKKF